MLGVVATVEVTPGLHARHRSPHSHRAAANHTSLQARQQLNFNFVILHQLSHLLLLLLLLLGGEGLLPCDADVRAGTECLLRSAAHPARAVAADSPAVAHRVGPL